MARNKKKNAPVGKTSLATRPTLPIERWIDARPQTAAILLYALLTVIFFGIIRPALFSPGMMIYGTDSMGAGVFFRSFYADFWRAHGTMPLWEPYIHGGMPFVDAMHGDIFYPAALLQIIFPVTYALGLKLILHVFLAGLFMYMFLREWGLGWRSSALGGILYMFTPCLVSLFYPGHDGKIYVTALTPLAFMFLHRGTVLRRLSSFFAFGLVYAFIILTAHVQMAYYLSWGLGLYFLYLIWDVHNFRPKLIAKPIAAFALAVVLAGGMSAVQWLSPYFYLQNYSQRIQHTEERGFEWSSSWSMHAEEAASLLVPEFPGDNLAHKQHTYWGQNYFKLNSEAVGVFAVFFALLILSVQRRRQAVFFAVLSLLALIYALGAGTPLFTLSYHIVPGVKKFRAPGMINFLYAFGIVAVAAWGINHLVHLPAKAPIEKKFIKHGVFIAGGYTLITLLVTFWGDGFFRAWADIFQGGLNPQKSAPLAANVSNVVTGLWISAILIWAGVGLIWARFNRSLNKTIFFGGLALLALIDLWRFDVRYVHLVDPNTYYQRSGFVDYLDRAKQDEGLFRTFILPQTVPDNYLAMYGLEEVSLSAMHGNHLLSYDNFTGRHEQIQNLVYPRFWDLLNITRIVSPLPAEDLIREAAKARRTDLMMIGKNLSALQLEPEIVDRFYVYSNEQALPRVCGFSGYRIVEDHEAVLTVLKEPDFRHRRELILEQEIPQLPPYRGDAQALREFRAGTIVDEQINEFTIEIDMPADGLVFLSENYYPAWKAEEDGGQLTIYRANYTFRAVFASAGKHTIRFYFDNPRFSQAKLFSAVSLILLVVGLVATGWRRKIPPVESRGD